MGLYSKIIDVQKLMAAWSRVRSNKPACGADNITWEQFDKSAKEYLKELNAELREHQYTCRPVKLVTLYKGEKAREIALYCMRDKVVQQSIAVELTKIFDPKFSGRTYAYRPNRSALAAVHEIEKVIRESGYSLALKTDITGFFDNILWEKLEGLLGRGIAERDVIELIHMSAMAKALQEDGGLREKRLGGRDIVHESRCKSSSAVICKNVFIYYQTRKKQPFLRCI